MMLTASITILITLKKKFYISKTKTMYPKRNIKIIKP